VGIQRGGEPVQSPQVRLRLEHQALRSASLLQSFLEILRVDATLFAMPEKLSCKKTLRRLILGGGESAGLLKPANRTHWS
jgi:hypothetical protein